MEDASLGFIHSTFEVAVVNKVFSLLQNLQLYAKIAASAKLDPILIQKSEKLGDVTCQF